MELCNLGDGALATILNRVPGAGVAADDTLLKVTGTETLAAFANDPETNTQMQINGSVNVQVSNMAGATVDIVSAALRWTSLGGQSGRAGAVPAEPGGRRDQHPDRRNALGRADSGR